jgi:cytoskeletal protein RodZ
MRVCRTRILSIGLAILLCCTPESLFAVTGQSAAPQNQQSTGTQSEAAPQNAAPVTSPLPEAPQAQPQQNSTGQTNPTSGQKSATTPQEPEGTAAARSARTIGGPASKPAGSAIAPAKQRQIRSLLIKIGAIAGAGAALGTVYALTRGTPSKPPGAH